jgi:excisionase family DNA binding protein
LNQNSILLTKDEAAERARLKPRTLMALVRSGRGPAITKLGGKTLFQKSALNIWIEANTANRPSA